MLTYTDLPLIPTQVIGSHGIPGWVWVVRDAIAEGKMGPADIEEALKDAVRLAIMDMVKIFNACVEGVDATIGFHLCFGNFRGRPATSHRSFAAFATHFKDLNADVIHIEFANRGMAEIELWEQHGGDKILCAGVIDVKGRDLEPVEVVADRIRTALNYCAPEKLWVAPDCGFSQTVRWLAVEKMKVMVQAARIVREEIGCLS